MTKKKYVKNLFLRVVLSIILFLSLSIFINFSDKNLLYFKKNIAEKSFNFSGFNKLYQKYFGKPLPDVGTVAVNQNTLNYTAANAYYDGVKLEGVNSVLPLKSGIVVFIGQKDNYGNTIIIQGMDGIDYWYANVTDIGIKLYDYVESDNIIANAKDSVLYLVFTKAGEILDFEEYI